jgi:feruloyl esterase
MGRLWVALIVLLASAMRFSSETAAAAGTPCESLRNLVLLDTTITLSQSYPAGSEPVPGYVIPVAICRVAAHIRPTSDSDIQMEAWLPSAGWNGKFLGVGTGRFLGQANYRELTLGIQRGYATVSSDMGHQGDAFDASLPSDIQRSSRTSCIAPFTK